MEILPSPLLNKITLRETACLNKGYQLRGRQILMLISDEFKVNADIGFTYSLEDLSGLAYCGDRNLQQFVNKWDSILAELEHGKIGAKALARMFENKLMTSKLLEAEVRHFRRLPDGHADKTYKWLRDMVDMVLQLEKEDKNQADLLAAHRAPIGSRPGAAVKGKEGKGNTEKKKGKGTSQNQQQDCKDWESDSGGSSDSSGQGFSKSKAGSFKGKGPRDTSNIPCKFMYMYGNCTWGDDCSFAHRTPTAEEIMRYGYQKTSADNSPRSGAGVSAKDKPCFLHGQGSCTYGDECRYSHDPATLASHRAERSKSKGWSKGKSRTRGAPTASDSE